MSTVFGARYQSDQIAPLGGPNTTAMVSVEIDLDTWGSNTSIIKLTQAQTPCLGFSTEY